MLKPNLINDLIDDPKLKSAMAKELLRRDTGELLRSIVPEDPPERDLQDQQFKTKVDWDWRELAEDDEGDTEVNDVEMSYDGVIQPMDPAEWGQEMHDLMERLRELIRRRPMTAPFGPTVGSEPTAYNGLTPEDD